MKVHVNIKTFMGSSMEYTVNELIIRISLRLLLDIGHKSRFQKSEFLEKHLDLNIKSIKSIILRKIYYALKSSDDQHYQHPKLVLWGQ